MSFKFNPKQREVQPLLGGLATWIMLFGGGRSGKTFILVRTIIARALKAPGSRHLITRYRFNHLKATVVLDTFPKVMRTCFPQLVKGHDWGISKTDWFATLPGDAEIWFCGLDDKERMEKILGFEFCTIYVNEASQVMWGGVQILLTRLAQLVDQVVNGIRGPPLKLRFFFDCNPPSKAHWSFKVFKQKTDPDTKDPLTNPDNYVCFQMNPRDNQENLSPEYLETLTGLSARMKRRFLDGEFADATPNALFDEAVIDRWRAEGEKLPDMVRVVVSVDPSGAGDDEANTDNDEIGITVDGLGTDGNAYLLEDITVKAGPAVWGQIAVSAYERHRADVVVGETNFGGGMVKFVVQAAAAKAKARVNFKMVTASRGKVQRAEPFSALYEQGKVRHAGIFAKLEDEMCAFSTTGYTGKGSPNRADAHIWALAELFPSLVKIETKRQPAEPRERAVAGAWMG
jgi:predicted phage terminase large subunit-like protein